MPSVGEQGWGELVNGNFSTIDATMSGLDTRIGTLETETDAIEERVTTLEAGNFETINCTGVITAKTIEGNISPCFGTLSSNEFAAFQLSCSMTLFSIGANANTTTSKTYRDNPFHNTFNFKLYARGQSNSAGATVRLSVNGSVVKEVYVSGNTYKEQTVTLALNNGDVLTFYGSSEINSNGYVSMSGSTWLINGS